VPLIPQHHSPPDESRAQKWSVAPDIEITFSSVAPPFFKTGMDAEAEVTVDVETLFAVPRPKSVLVPQQKTRPVRIAQVILSETATRFP
jgi:hypothetical protein